MKTLPFRERRKLTESSGPEVCGLVGAVRAWQVRVMRM